MDQSTIYPKTKICIAYRGNFELNRSLVERNDIDNYSCEINSRLWRCILDATLCGKVWQYSAGRSLSSGTQISCNNRTHDTT